MSHLYIFRHSVFTSDALPLLLKQNYENTPNIINDLFKFNEKDIISMSDRIDLCILYLKESKSNRFKNISEKCNFTLEQLNKLSDSSPKLCQNICFFWL